MDKAIDSITWIHEFFQFQGFLSHPVNEITDEYYEKCLRMYLLTRLLFRLQRNTLVCLVREKPKLKLGVECLEEYSRLEIVVLLGPDSYLE